MVPALPPEAAVLARALWRRRRLVVATAWAFALVGWIVLALQPDLYQSMARIYVQTETMLQPLLRNITVEADIQRQLDMMQRTLVNSTNLAEVARAAGFDAGIHDDADREALYRRLQKRIEVKVEGRNLFSVTYADSDPRRAQAVVATLLALFIEANTGQNRTNMENAKSFIERQLAEYEAQLKEVERHLAEYKAQHYDVLSATGSNFSGRLESARHEVAAAKMRHEEAVIARDQMRAHLAGVPQYIEVENAPQVVMSGGATTTIGRLRQAEAALNELRLRFTDRHPDVTAAMRTVEQLQAAAQYEAEHGPAPTGAAVSRLPNSLYEQVKLRLMQADSQVATAQSQLNLANEVVERVSALGATAPGIEAGLADLNREYGVLKGRYEDLLGRRESARISEAAESSGDKVVFRVVEEAQLPVVPSSPNRPLFATLVLVLALAAGGALALLLHHLDDAMDSTEAIVSSFNIKVLGAIPRVENDVRTAERVRKLKHFATAGAALFACYGVVLLLSFHHDRSAAGPMAEPVAESGADVVPAAVEKGETDAK